MANQVAGSQTKLAADVEALNSKIENIGTLNAVTISNTSLNRVYRYVVGGNTMLLYGLVGFNSTTAEISGLPANNTGRYVPVALFDTNTGSSSFFNINPNATTVSLNNIVSGHYYIVLCVYLTTS